MYKENNTEPIEKGHKVGCSSSVIGPAGILIFIGILLSATGIGMLIGIPLIIAGLIVPFFYSVAALAGRKGNCPYCDFEVESPIAQDAMNCPVCKNRIIIKNNKFIRLS